MMGIYSFETVTSLNDAAQLIPRRRYGILSLKDGKFASLSFRPWPKLISRFEIATLGRWTHYRQTGDQIRLFFNIPVTSPRFLTLAYIESTQGTSWKTVRRSMELLDWIAEKREVLATVCELSNVRISDRLMSRLGYQTHCPNLSGRHFIKRFYGKFPCYSWIEKQCPSPPKKPIAIAPATI